MKSSSEQYVPTRESDSTIHNVCSYTIANIALQATCDMTSTCIAFKAQATKRAGPTSHKSEASATCA
eukprot:3206046-Amphidinium_carterae.1